MGCGDGGTDPHLPGHSSSVESVAFSPDRARVLSGSWDNTLKDEGSAFPKLNYTVADATAFAEEMNKAGEGVYGRVQVSGRSTNKHHVQGLTASSGRLLPKFNRATPSYYLQARYGNSNRQNDRFYLIPQDNQGGTNSAALASRAIGQDRLQGRKSH